MKKKIENLTFLSVRSILIWRMNTKSSILSPGLYHCHRFLRGRWFMGNGACIVQPLGRCDIAFLCWCAVKPISLTHSTPGVMRKFMLNLFLFIITLHCIVAGVQVNICKYPLKYKKKVTPAEFQKMFCPSFIKLRIQTIECLRIDPYDLALYESPRLDLGW